MDTIYLPNTYRNVNAADITCPNCKGNKVTLRKIEWLHSSYPENTIWDYYLEGFANPYYGELQTFLHNSLITTW